MRHGWFHAAAVGAALASAQPLAIAQEIEEAQLRWHTHVLAHDSLEGRGTASAGERRAARYIVKVLEEMGAAPLPGAPGYRLPVPLLAFPVEATAASLTVRTEGGSRILSPPGFYHPGGSTPAFRDFQGRLVFAGATTGALDALAEFDDLAGYVVLVGPPWDGLTELQRALLLRRAEGAILAVPSGFYDRLRVVRGPTRFALREQVADSLNQSPLPAAVVGPEVLAALGIEADLVPGRTLDRAEPRPATVEVRHGIAGHESRTGYNVAAMIPGADPALADEAVLFVAHYDHVGFGEPADGDSIWNGFVDNAAGVAILLEVARLMAADPPARSAVFLFTTAEEQGLLGASWFVHDPPLPLDRIRAVINIDGGAPPGEPAAFQLAGAGASPAGAIAGRAVIDLGYDLVERPISPDSDHWAFHVAGVPSLFLYPGALAGVDAETARALYARWSRPHTPHDEWHPDFPFEGMVHYGRAALGIGRRLADEPLSLAEIIERNTAAMGGRERLERLRSVQVVRNPNMIVVTQRPHFHIVELFDDDGHMRYAEGFDGRTAWEQTAGDTARRPVTGRPAEALWRVLQWPGPLNPLDRLESQGHSLSLLSDTVLDGTRYHQLAISLSDGFRKVYFVNATTYLLERARDHRRLHAVDEAPQPIEGAWGDFRDVDGYVFPFYSEERNYVTGECFYGSTMLDVQVNVDLPESEFGLDGTSRPDRLHAVLRRLGLRGQ